MNTKTTAPKSYFDMYQSLISPQLKEIDIFIKCQQAPYSVKAIAKLLQISQEEVMQIMQEQNIIFLDKGGLIRIMKAGSSDICRMFSRILKSGIPKKYLPNDISYIYNIDIDKVLNACEKMGISVFNEHTLMILLSNIYL